MAHENRPEQSGRFFTGLKPLPLAAAVHEENSICLPPRGHSENTVLTLSLVCLRPLRFFQAPGGVDPLSDVYPDLF